MNTIDLDAGNARPKLWRVVICDCFLVTVNPLTQLFNRSSWCCCFLLYRRTLFYGWRIVVYIWLQALLETKIEFFINLKPLVLTQISYKYWRRPTSPNLKSTLPSSNYQVALVLQSHCSSFTLYTEVDKFYSQEQHQEITSINWTVSPKKVFIFKMKFTHIHKIVNK